MRNPLPTAGAWSHKAWLALKAFEAALDRRYEDYAQERFDRLERRVAALEEGHLRTSLPHPSLNGRTNP